MTTNHREGPSREAVEEVLRGLDRADLAAARWYGDKGRPIEDVTLDEAFVLDAGASHVLAIAGFRSEDGRADPYLVALTGDPLRPADPGDGAWRALAAAMADGRTIAALPTVDAEGDLVGPVTAALVCRPGRAMPPGVATAVERDLGADQSNTSVVLGGAVLLKAYRRVQPGLNPELELVAYLSEQAGFPAVPPLAGYAEVVSARDGVATVAIAQAFVADGADAYESIAEALTAWLLAPGEVSVEFATEVAADLGTLTAGMHAALASARDVPGFEPRPATLDDLRRWSADAREQLDRALEVTVGDAARLLRELAPRIAEAFTTFDALASAPLLTRIHADYHLGQVLIAPDGFRVVDFEGEPFRTPDERRAPRSPLRDVASMLRSIDHVGRSADRRAQARNGGPLEAPGLDLAGWLRRARERFLEAYRSGLRQAGAPIVVDPELIRAFEIEKECYEFVYATTYLPSWIWAPTEGMRGLFEGDGDMTADRPRRMLDDVLGWPATLAALLDAYAHDDGPLSVLDGLVAQRILITGLGSSRFAAMTIAAHLRTSSMTAWVEVASPDAPTRPSHEMLTFAVSASGRTAEVVNAVDRHRHTGAVVGVTNQPGSPVADGADAVLPLMAGDETSGVSCRSYGATLAVLGLAAARLGAYGPTVDELREAVPALRKLHRGRGTWLTTASDLLDGAPSIDVVSGSRRPGSARQAALMLREGPRLPATAQEAPDWSHTAIYTALPGHRAVVFDGTPHDSELVRLIAGRGGASIVVGDPLDAAALSIPVPLAADAHPITRAIVETAVIDLLAAELWRRADASG